MRSNYPMEFSFQDKTQSDGENPSQVAKCDHEDAFYGNSILLSRESIVMVAQLN